MREFRIRWSPNKSGVFVIPGDNIIDNGAKPFRVDWHKIICPDLFRQTSLDHDWPRLRVDHWRDDLKDIIADKDIADGCPSGMRAQCALLSMALFNDELSLEDYAARMEIMPR